MTAHTGEELRNVPTCNLTVSRQAHAAGAKAYLVNAGASSHELLIRSRSGRWVRKWERVKNVTNWRYTTVIPESSAYPHLWFYKTAPEHLRRLPVDVS